MEERTHVTIPHYFLIHIHCSLFTIHYSFSFYSLLPSPLELVLGNLVVQALPGNLQGLGDL